MPRPKRIEFKNAWYHIMNRGAGRKCIFPNDELKSFFISLLGEICEEFHLEIHAYCLMGNHFHLLIKTLEPNLNLAMQKLTSCYTRRHNRLLRTDGPLFRGRYKAILVAEVTYLAAVSRYIHRNPKDAKLVKEAKDYIWSSFPAYCNVQPKPDWLVCNEVSNLVSPRHHMQDYIGFVENNLVASMREFYNSPRLPGVLGSKAARELIAHKTGYHDNWYPKDRIQLKEIAFQVAQAFDVPESKLFSSGTGKANPWRSFAMHMAQVKGRYSVMEIAEWMQIKPSSVTQALHHFRKTRLHDPYFANQITTI
jgi:REP element-mobilizing transposase RayT